MKEEIIVNIPYHEEDKHLNIDGSVINLGNYKITIVSRPKTPTKDFSFYVDQYLYENGSTNDQIVNWLSDDIISVAKYRLKTNQFSLVPWEVKMGLFRFICDEHKMTWNDIVGFFVYYNSGTINNCSEQYLGNRVISILPQEFIDDLFKTKN